MLADLFAPRAQCAATVRATYTNSVAVGLKPNVSREKPFTIKSLRFFDVHYPGPLQQSRDAND